MDYALMFVRLVVGSVFLVHGYPKFFGGVDGFAKWLKKRRFRLPKVNAWAAATTEFWGGLLVLLGIYTEYVALLLMVVMIVATVVNIKDGKKFKDGWELDVALLALCLLLAYLGGGEYSLGALIP